MRLKIFFSAVVLMFSFFCFAQPPVPTFNHVAYDAGINNWLNIYQAKSDKPRPVVIWAHANGTTAKGLPRPLYDSLMKYHISVVNWESVPQLESKEQLDTAENDFMKMFAWVKANAATYNFDIKNVYVAGGSRGTVVSFAGANQMGSQIRGIYFVEAVPVRSWLIRDFVKMITPQSPKMVLCYINPFGTSNAHNPDKAVAIVEQYKKLGMNDKVKLYQGIGKEHLFDALVPFVLEGRL